MLLLLLTLTLAANLNAQNDLPCFDSSEVCVQKLTAQAVANSEENKVLDATIKLARRKGWTQYIDVSAIDPLTLSVQILRNIFGGGERQQRKLSIAQIELRRSETVQKIRAEITNLLIEAESFERKRLQLKMLYDAQSSLVAVLEISYESGELSTERMMPVWEKLDYFKIEIQTAETERESIRKNLIILIEPKPLVELTREDARRKVIEDVTQAWKLSGTTEELNLIVLNADEKRRVYKSEILKVFPEGVKHLPDELQSREIYPTTKNGRRKVQYIGKAVRFGFNFVLFRELH
jgi:CRISPR/Cas system-associated exonuclease Cas4 (RecB family)